MTNFSIVCARPLCRLLVALVLIGLFGCAARQAKVDNDAHLRDIHERLSAIAVRDGFFHSVRTRRNGNEDQDAVYIRIPLDTLKRRHASLEKLMKDIGRACAAAEFAHLPIRIEIGAGDEDDRLYLKEALAPTIAGRKNILINASLDEYNDIIVTIIHRHLD
ncbi:MAG TPA: hypothetical protein VJ001_12535 [Rhodocyclaceae bacterium]|nr:hypothetical protein [Rhodocyclaceae bacterium]